MKMAIKRHVVNVSKDRLELTLDTRKITRLGNWLARHAGTLLVLMSVGLAAISWFYISSRLWHLSYNDAMSHLDISRRVVDSLTPGAAQLGSVWLPLLHVLMLPTIWIDSFWRTGMSAGIVSMGSYVLTVWAVFQIAKLFKFKTWIAVFASLVVALNTNFLYLQTTALTEPLFMGMYSLAVLNLLRWVKTHKMYALVQTAFWVVMASLTRYDGWALLGFATLGVVALTWLKGKSLRQVEGLGVMFLTLASFGVVLWLGWNFVIFGDPLFFASGEFSAKAQQDVLAGADDLPTKHNLGLSLLTYAVAMNSNLGILNVVLAILGWGLFLWKRGAEERVVAMVMSAPLAFNILALFLGHSVIHLPELFGQSWFNVRYGLLLLPWVAVAIGFLVSQKNVMIRAVVMMIVVFQVAGFLNSGYVVTLDDGLWGSSQKNVVAIGKWIREELEGNEEGLLLASVASHDAILFQTGLNMDRYVHEGTGDKWDEALADPDSHVEYVIMRTHDDLDSVSRAMDEVDDFFDRYELVYDGEFADVYRVKYLREVALGQ